MKAKDLEQAFDNGKDITGERMASPREDPLKPAL